MPGSRVTVSKENAGPSLFDMMWHRLDEYVDKLKAGTADEGDEIRAEELANIIAIFTNPYGPNLKEVRRESTRRWKFREAKKSLVRSAS